jgi:FdhD protein
MNDLILRKDDVDFLMCCLQSRSGLFKETGCAHASALGIGRRMIYFSEDLGRLNAIDKAIGHLLLDLGNPADKVLLTTGRVSSRMVLKVARVGIPVIASKAAPTDRAVELARESNVTLLGFLRENRVNVYTNEDRVV